MGVEFGIFSEDGLVEREFDSQEEAEEILATCYDLEEDLAVYAICPLHDEPVDYCSLCSDNCCEEEE